jgi:hypothetical protein
MFDSRACAGNIKNNPGHPVVLESKVLTNKLK